MTLGTRVTVVTTLVVASVLAGSGYAALKVRRANLEADWGPPVNLDAFNSVPVINRVVKAMSFFKDCNF